MSRRAALLVATVGAIALTTWFLLNRPGPPPATASGAAVPWEFLFQPDHLDISGADDASESVAAAVAEALATVPGGSVPDGGGLAAMIRDRVRLLIAPPKTLEAWKEAMAEFGEPPEHLRDPSPDSLELWKSATATLDGARIDPGRVRVIRVKASDLPAMTPGTFFVRPSTRVAGLRYKRPPSTAETCVDVQFGSEMKASNGERYPATVSIRCWYDGLKWAPYEMTVYMDSRAMGRTFQFPAF
jgi:hypothetical protein